MTLARVICLVVASALLAAGCNAGERRPGPPAPAPQASGYFVGRTPGGLGVAVDLAGYRMGSLNEQPASAVAEKRAWTHAKP